MKRNRIEFRSATAHLAGEVRSPAVCLPSIAAYVYKAYKRIESLVRVVLGIDTSYPSRARTFDWIFLPAQYDSEKGPPCLIDFTIVRFVSLEYY